MILLIAILAAIPAVVAFGLAHLSRHHTTRTGALRRVRRLLVGAFVWVAIGFLATRGEDDACGGAEDCMFRISFDPLIWAIVLAPALIWIMYALATLTTLGSADQDFLE